MKLTYQSANNLGVNVALESNNSGLSLVAPPQREGLGFFATNYEMYMQETILGDMMRYGIIPQDRNASFYNYDDGVKFNPYAFWDENRVEYGDVEEWLKQGMFEDVYGQKQFKDRVARLRQLQKHREDLSNGNFFGMLTGGLLTFADVSTLIPAYGLFKKGKTLATISRYAVGGGIFVGAQEASLHLRQELRTVDESITNLAFTMAIGGGVGAFASAGFKGSALYPGAKNNPFNPNNPVYLAIGDIGRGMKNSVVFQPIIQGGKRTWKAGTEKWEDLGKPGSVGAAAVVKATGAVGSGAKRVGTGAVQAVGKAGMYGLNKLAKTRIVGSPIYRLLTNKSQRAQRIGELLFDTGGILTKGNLQGKYLENVEQVANRIRARFDEVVFPAAVQRYVDLRIALAKLQGKDPSKIGISLADTGARMATFSRQVLKGPRKTQPDTLKTKGQIEEFEFTDLTNKALYDDITDAELKNLRERFGDDGADLIVKAAKDQAESIHAMNKSIEDDMLEIGMIKPSQAMGRSYGKAQLWISSGIAANTDRAKEFFMRLLSDEIPDDWLNANYGMSKQQFDELGKSDVKVGDTTYNPADGLIVKNEIFEDWNGALRRDTLELAEAEVDVATKRVERTRKEAVIAASNVRKTDTQIKKSEVKEAEAIVKERMLEQQKRKAQLDKIKLEIEQVKLQLRKQEAEQNIRDNQFHDVTKQTQKLKKERQSEVLEAEELLKLAEKNAETRLANLDKQGRQELDDLIFAKDNLIKKDNELASAGDDALQEAVDKAKTKKVGNQITGRLEGRLQILMRQGRRLQDAIANVERKLGPVKKAVAEANKAKIDLRNARKVRNQFKRLTAGEAKKAKTQLKKAKRILKKTTAKPSLEEYVDKLLLDLSSPNHRNSLTGGLDAEYFTSGRTKDRQFKLTNEQRREAEEMGILRNDLYGIMMKSMEDLSARIAIRKVFQKEGIELGNEGKIVDELQLQVKEEYQTLINNAKKAGKSERTIVKLEKDRQIALDDIEKGIKRHLGILGRADTSKGYGLAWAGQMARSVNYIRYGSGFLLPSLADLANVVFTSGWGTFSYLNLFSRKNSQLRKAVVGLNNQEIIRLATASERILSNSRTMKMAGADTTREMAGLGAPGSLTHYTTSNAEKIVDGFSQATNVVSFMGWWNTRMKSLVMLEMQHNFVESIRNYDNLLAKASAQSKAELEIAKLANVGLGQSQIAGIRKMFAKHPPTKTDGLWEMEMGRWLDEGEVGVKAFNDVMTALESVATRAIMTPGKGDLPYFMSEGIWKTILQFWTYGFVSMSKYMIPAFQRMARYGDMEAFASLSLATALGTGIVMLSDLRYQGSIKERSLGQWGYDVADRAGFLMMLSVPLAEAGRTLGIAEKPSRYSSEKNRMSLIGGPTGGLITDVLDLKDAISDGDGDRIQQVGNKLLPFKLYKQIYDVTIGDK